VVVMVVEQPKNKSGQKFSLTKGGGGTDSTYQRCTEPAMGKLIQILSTVKVASVKTTNLAEDLGKKMKLLRTPDMNLVDLDGLTAQVFMAKPRSCKNKRTQKGEWCCEQHCLLVMHHSAQTKMEIRKRDAAELGEMEGLFDESNETEEDDGLFQSTTLDMEAALVSTNLL
jgi:hypothetical protein